MPVVNYIWNKENANVINEFGEQCENGGAKLAGDGRCDSPGHCAKYGLYSFMDQDTGKILSFRITQVSEAGNSNRMEKCGFQLVLNSLKSKIDIKQITTDRHVRVRKYMVEEQPNIELQFDI